MPFELARVSNLPGVPRARGFVVECKLENQQAILRCCIARYLQSIFSGLGSKEIPPVQVSPEMQDFKESWWSFEEKSDEARSALS